MERVVRLEIVYNVPRDGRSIEDVAKEAAAALDPIRRNGPPELQGIHIKYDIPIFRVGQQPSRKIHIELDIESDGYDISIPYALLKVMEPIIWRDL